MNIKELNNNFEITLHKPNRSIIGELTMLTDNVNINKKIDDIDTISFDISRDLFDRFSHIENINMMYNEIKEERLILFNNKEYYVIKNVNESDSHSNVKSVECLSLEHKLTRINISLEDIGIVLFEEDADKNYLSLEYLIKNETGWTLNHVDDSVRYEFIQNEKVVRARWQESINMSWYSFLTEEIANSFLCLIEFDTLNKYINIYNLDTYGENIELYLSKDNYIKSLEKSTSSNDIVTRLRLTGKDEIDIRSVNPMGVDYVEDYSYFINNGDMSDSLINALNKHNSILEENQKKWSNLSTRKLELDKKLIEYRSKLYMVCENIKELTTLKTNYESLNDEVNAEYIGKQIEEKNLEKNIIEQDIRNIEYELQEIITSISDLNNQLDRRIAVDDYGDKIFTDEDLWELNEFLYYDSYVNNSFITPESLIEGGMAEIKKRCSPSIEYNVDVQDFIGRIINHKSKGFNGNLNLGDLIVFFDDVLQKEYYLYLVGYEYSPCNNNLVLCIGNKKSKINNTINIANKLRDVVNMNNYINSKQYMLNQLKYNKL